MSKSTLLMEAALFEYHWWWCSFVQAVGWLRSSDLEVGHLYKINVVIHWSGHWSHLTITDNPTVKQFILSFSLSPPTIKRMNYTSQHILGHWGQEKGGHTRKPFSTRYQRSRCWFYSLESYGICMLPVSLQTQKQQDKIKMHWHDLNCFATSNEILLKCNCYCRSCIQQASTNNSMIMHR